MLFNINTYLSFECKVMQMFNLSFKLYHTEWTFNVFYVTYNTLMELILLGHS